MEDVEQQCIKEREQVELEKDQKQYKQIYDDKLNDLIPEFLFKEKKQELGSKIKNEKEKLEEVEKNFNTLNKLEDKEELIVKAIDDIKKNGLTKEELSILFDKIVVFDQGEIMKEQKDLYNLNDMMYNVTRKWRASIPLKIYVPTNYHKQVVVVIVD